MFTNVLSFEFLPVKMPRLIANDEWPPIHPPHSTGLSGLGAILESYHELLPKPKTVPKFKEALLLIWSALPEKAIDIDVKDCCKRLQAFVAAVVDILNI